MSRKDQFVKVVTYSVGVAGKLTVKNISPNEADLAIIKSVLMINFVLEKLNKFLPEKA